MHTKLSKLSALCALSFLISCEKSEQVANDKENASRVHVDQISPEMRAVRDYVPKFAVIAHRGSTFWAPEETEAAFRWAREMGADYLEADLQVSKDGVILALHDDNLRRTTNIDQLYGADVPESRLAYYKNLKFEDGTRVYTDAQAEELFKADKKLFYPYSASSYMYEELLALDAGTWFNNSSPNQARAAFSTEQQYVSSLEDLISYARGYKLDRAVVNGINKRVAPKKYYALASDITGALDGAVRKAVRFEAAYVADVVNGADKSTNGNRPGIYIEFKESWLNPSDIEQRVYDELKRLNMNVAEQVANGQPFYKNGNVNVGETNGKVILQTFSLQSLVRVAKIFNGKVPMCFLLWKGTGATDLTYDDPLGYASFINLGLKHKAHIIGPCIAGAPNNYPDLNKPWQDYLIKKSGMLNHPYSFDTREQMAQYYGDYNFGVAGDNLFQPPYLDGMFTNRSEMTLKFFADKGVRDSGAPSIPNAQDLLDKLGY
jgi:glycerophosphoryl diester phosphodiesterase